LKGLDQSEERVDLNFSNDETIYVFSESSEPFPKICLYKEGKKKLGKACDKGKNDICLFNQFRQQG